MFLISFLSNEELLDKAGNLEATLQTVSEINDIVKNYKQNTIRFLIKRKLPQISSKFNFLSITCSFSKRY